jgi:hypothetical protein
MKTDARPSTSEQISILLGSELSRLGRDALEIRLCLSDASWRATMAALGCPAWNARLASPTARRGTRGKLGMATICHLRHGHAGVVYIKTRGRTWAEIAETVRHEALHLARPSYNHRQVEAALGKDPVSLSERSRGSAFRP